MPKPLSRSATRAPMRPRPTTPTVLSSSSTPEYVLRFHAPPLSAALAGAMLRAVARSRPTASSAAEVMLEVGALTTMTPAWVADCTSTLSRPTPARAMTLSFGAAAIASASIFVAERISTASTSASAGSSSPRLAPSAERTSKSGPSASIVAGDSSSAMRTTGLLTGDPFRTGAWPAHWSGRGPSEAPRCAPASLGASAWEITTRNHHVNSAMSPGVGITSWTGRPVCRNAAPLSSAVLVPADRRRTTFGFMRVVVTGAAGDLGARVVRELTGRGHEVVPASRRTGVDLVSGEGLDAVLAGGQSVVHCADDPSRGDWVTVYGTRRLADAAAAHDVHLVHISIVGIDDHPLAYYRRKLRAEQAVAAAGGSATVLRATQFHSLAASFARRLSIGPVTLTVGALAFQSVDTD